MAVRRQRTCPGRPWRRRRPITSTDAVWLAGLGEGPEGIASVPAPDSYPHVTCGCPVTDQRPRRRRAGSAAITGSGMAVTRTPAPWRRPAPAPSNSPAARGTAIPGAIAGNFPVMTAPRVTSAGKDIPLAKAGRHDRPGAPGAGPPARRGSRGRGCVLRGRGPGHGQARIRVPTAPACYRYGPGRAGQIGGPAGRSPSGEGIGSGLGLSIAESRPPGRLWVRGPRRAVLVPVVSVLFPEPGRGRDCPGTGPGRAVRAVR